VSLRCDLDPCQDIRLPAPLDKGLEGLKTLETTWITKSGFEAILQNNQPNIDDLVSQDELWQSESRVGIQRDEVTRTTKEGALYSPHHIRLSHDTQLRLHAKQLPECQVSGIAPVGGESRACFLEIEDLRPEHVIPALPEIHRCNGDLYYTVIVLTPLSIDAMPHPKGRLENLPGEIVSACLPRPQRWGGWDSVACAPLPLEPYIAPGSVFFMKAPESEKPAIQAVHGETIGNRADWGFGLIAIGTWKEGE
jgi:CRISPR-associated protein Cmr3